MGLQRPSHGVSLSQPQVIVNPCIHSLLENIQQQLCYSTDLQQEIHRLARREGLRRNGENIPDEGILCTKESTLLQVLFTLLSDHQRAATNSDTKVVQLLRELGDVTDNALTNRDVAIVNIKMHSTRLLLADLYFYSDIRETRLELIMNDLLKYCDAPEAFTHLTSMVTSQQFNAKIGLHVAALKGWYDNKTLATKTIGFKLRSKLLITSQNTLVLRPPVAS